MKKITDTDYMSTVRYPGDVSLVAAARLADALERFAAEPELAANECDGYALDPSEVLRFYGDYRELSSSNAWAIVAAEFADVEDLLDYLGLDGVNPGNVCDVAAEFVERHMLELLDEYGDETFCAVGVTPEGARTCAGRLPVRYFED